ncbi:MAG: DUF349 domain-containing protein [Salinivirgaceae bacterium]
MNVNEFNEKPKMPENENSPASENQQNASDDNKQEQNETVNENAAGSSLNADAAATQQPATENHKKEAEEDSDNSSASGTFSEQGELLPPEQSPYEEEAPEEIEDYSKLSKDQLTSELERVLNDFEVQKIRQRVEVIKSQFYKKHQRDVAKEREAYIEEHGDEKGFQPTPDPVNDAFNKLMQLYKEKRSEYLAKIEKTKEDNRKEREDIIEGIKALINKKESLNNTFDEFRGLQDRWKNAGKIAQGEMREVWEKYHFAVEQFYDFVKINKELRDLDLKKNLEAKIKLCEAAEKLVVADGVVRAFKTLQEYHQQWREIGPVPREQRDEIWDRFKNATVSINKRHQEFFENLKKEQQKNLEAKEALCKKVEEINKLKLVKPKKWDEKSQEIIDIQKLWKTIGFAPKKLNNEIYQRFKTACDEFFDKKRDFYSEKHSEEQENLDKKTELCIQAEAMKTSTDWKQTTEEFIKLQKEWKKVGPVPRRNSEAIWKRFRAACDHFFEAKKGFFANADQRYEENLAKKMELIDKVKNFQRTNDDEADLKVLSDYQKEWSEIGFVPFNKKEEVQKEFRQAINKHFDSMKIEDEKRNLMNFRNKIENWTDNPRLKRKIGGERNKIINTIKELENEITLYDNNIGFFSNSKSSNALVEDIKNKIERAKKRISLLRQKLDVLDENDG